MFSNDRRIAPTIQQLTSNNGYCNDRLDELMSSVKIIKASCDVVKIRTLICNLKEVSREYKVANRKIIDWYSSKGSSHEADTLLDDPLATCKDAQRCVQYLNAHLLSFNEEKESNLDSSSILGDRIQ